MSPVRAPRWRAVRALVACAVGLTALGWGLAPSAGAQDCGPAPQGRVAVAVVTDDGAAAPSSRCVEVPERATGYDVLVAAGHTLRIEAGFLCAIDGVPATGCGNRPDFGGAYWRYFHAAPAGDWTYATVGGGGYRMSARCAVEGWRFATSGNEQIAPRIAPPPVTCEAPPATVPSTSPPATSPPATAVPPPVGADGGAVVPPAGGTAPGATTTPPASTVAPGGAGDGGVDETSSTTTSEASVAGRASERSEDGSEDAASGAADEGSSTPGGGSSAVGLVLGVVLVGALGGAAWWRARARRPVLAEGNSTEGP